MKEVSTSRTPEECLRLAMEATAPAARAQLAEEGLAQPNLLEADTEVLLLRQLYLAELEAHHFRTAADIAEEMAALGPLKDVAHHDASRALLALGELREAIDQQRLAARAAPPDRRSFHYWSLATLLHHNGSYEAAISALARGERWAHEDRPLLRAHRAWMELEVGDSVLGLNVIIGDLEASKAKNGYGRFVLGMLHHQMGDPRSAALHLRAFLRRNAAVDMAKAITLREELRRARSVLAEIESD